MIEIPEAVHISNQIAENLTGQMIARSRAAASAHKFAWYERPPEEYPELLDGRTILGAHAAGGMNVVQLDGVKVVLSEGAAPRLFNAGDDEPKKHQLFLSFRDGRFLTVTVRMYGGILAFRDGEGENKYYQTAVDKPSPLQESFDWTYFNKLLSGEGNTKLSAKAFLATEQRIPGLGNGTLQDVLYIAGIHPKRKMDTLDEEERSKLFDSIKNTLREMAEKGGRDTENDLFGNPGGYRTRCSKHTAGKPCPTCSNLIEKGSYMGGTIYFCPECQEV